MVMKSKLVVILVRYLSLKLSYTRCRYLNFSRFMGLSVIYSCVGKSDKFY